jgi:transposase
METELQVETLDHLGLVAGVIDELGLVELTNEQFPEHHQNCISSGQVVKALILNGLGFLSAPLYLVSEFFSNKPVSHLLGERVEARHLNDDRIGRVLDGLFHYGSTEFFLKAALQAVARFGVETSQLHLDSSSFAVEGEYQESEPAANPVQDGTTPPGGDEIQPIRICRGYSRDQRPDLKQYLVNLVCSRDGGVPLWLRVADGNQNDAQHFAGIMSEFAAQWQLDSMFVIDAAFYSEANLKAVSTLQWLSRVPQTLSAAKALIARPTDELKAIDCQLKDYQMWEVRQTYGEIEQRWILVESQSRKAEKSLWQKELSRIERRLKGALKKLQQTVFACRPDAYEALLQFQAQLESHQLVEVRIVPVMTRRPPGLPRSQSFKASTVGYRIAATLRLKSAAEAEFTRQHSRFILATNELDEQTWTAEKLLREYKQQQKVERGFRFLKDPLFFTSSVFVKKPERVEALALIMALTLLVYSLAERKLRASLAAQQQTVLDQKQRPTSTPTFRWILQKFQGIHLVTLRGIQQMANLTQERELIIRLLGPPTCRYYLLSDNFLTCGM